MIEYSEYKSELKETAKEITMSIMKVWIVIGVYCFLLFLGCVGVLIFVDASVWKQAIMFFMPFISIVIVCLSYYKKIIQNKELIFDRYGINGRLNYVFEKKDGLFYIHCLNCNDLSVVFSKEDIVNIYKRKNVTVIKLEKLKVSVVVCFPKNEKILQLLNE